jgi:hypothetical protein
MLYVCMHVQMCLYVLLAEWLLPANTCSLSGTGNPWVPVTRSGTGMGTNLYPSAGTGFLMGVFFLRGHGYGLVVPNGYVPVAILSHNVVQHGSYALKFVHAILQKLFILYYRNI